MQGLQLGHEGGVVALPFGAGLLDGRQPLADRVDQHEQGGGDVRAEGEVAVAELAQEVLTHVGDRLQLGEPEEPAGALDGVDGTPGTNGAPGIKGHKGAAGANGIPAPLGEPGLNGLNGLPGPDGTQGVKGERGLPGFRGTDMLKGKSALSVCVHKSTIEMRIEVISLML